MIRAEQKVYVGSAQKLKKDRSRRPWRCNTASLNNFCFNKNIFMAVTLCKAASTENRYTNCKKLSHCASKLEQPIKSYHLRLDFTVLSFNYDI